MRVCSQCHSAEIVIFYDRSEEQWSYTVHQMADNGANATDQEFEQVLDYLIKYVAIIDMNTVDGYAVNGPRHLILASDHNQGVFLPLDLSEQYDMDALVDRLQKFVAIE